MIIIMLLFLGNACFEMIGEKKEEEKNQGTQKHLSVTHKWVSTQCLGNSGLHQWFPNFLASDPKETFDVCPGPKLVKTADLQAHNASLRAALRACRSAIFTNSHLFAN